MHRYLEDPDRARAYALLIERPNGTLRTWATALGWTTGKLQRFIASLSRYRLGAVRADRHGTTFEPLGDAKVHRLGASVCTDVHRCASAPYLGSNNQLDKVPRYGVPPADKLDNSGAPRLIEALNEEMVDRFGENYTPIRHDHRGSGAAARRIAEAGVPLEKAINLLRRSARVFNPEKAGGKLPRSVGFFTPWILRSHRFDEQQPSLPLQSLIVTAPSPARVIGSKVLQLEQKNPTSDEAVAAFRAEFERAAAERPARA